LFEIPLSLREVRGRGQNALASFFQIFDSRAQIFRRQGLSPQNWSDENGEKYYVEQAIHRLRGLGGWLTAKYFAFG
jgi:hypothetical protein